MIALALALALQATQTDCTPADDGGVSCTTRPRTGGLIGLIAESNRRKQEAQERSQRDALRKAVGAAAAEGRCDEAKAMALRAGDFDLAQQAAALCSAAPKP